MRWFKHDTDAHRDAKLKRVIIKYGMEGYGLYWHCIELIASNIDHHNLTFELEHDAEIISHDTGIHPERVQEMVAYMVDQGLFENSTGTITCMKLAKRLDQSMTSNTKLRRSINELQSQNHDGVMTESGDSHDDVMREQKRTEQKRIGEKRERFTPPTEDEVREYCRERGNSVDPSRFVNFYAAKGWMVGKNKMKDWKAAIRTWENQGDGKKSEDLVE